jgi:hypothetical protein
VRYFIRKINKKYLKGNWGAEIELTYKQAKKSFEWLIFSSDLLILEIELNMPRQMFAIPIRPLMWVNSYFYAHNI